jgi:hypothetical protein
MRANRYCPVLHEPSVGRVRVASLAKARRSAWAPPVRTSAPGPSRVWKLPAHANCMPPPRSTC